MNRCPDTGLPVGEAPAPLVFDHFPTRWQTVLWRNWGLVTPARLAKVLNATEETLACAAAAMGLGAGASEETERRWLQRGYITLIRQNWHLLPYQQLLDVIGRSSQEMAYALKEDDFLWNKLGRLKPAAGPVVWRELTSEQERRTEELRARITATFGAAPTPAAERPFDFLERYGRLAPSAPVTRPDAPFGLRLVYSYAAVYGDPLLDGELDPYPEGLLDDLAANRVNAVWLQGVLYTLVPWFGDTEYSAGCATRRRNLNALIRKAAERGIGVYLYLNEPRAMPPEFYARWPEWQGPFYQATGLHAMCVSHPEVLDKLQAGVRELFRQAPGLAGVFTITMSENLTHCHSKRDQLPACPRCAQRNTGDIVASVNNAIAAGAHAAKPAADVIAWCWAWADEWWQDAIDAYRPGIRVMCTSESRLETEAMGVKGTVSDYTLSKVGPGPFSTRIWRHARARGLEVLAKVQLNNTWECSAVPYLPVPFLARQHVRNLEAEGVSGLMTSWTLGGYPGGNLPAIDGEPEDLAVELFGPEAAPVIVAAWQQFGAAFAEFPLHGTSCLYTGPQNYGPMNLLFAEPTGWSPTMVGFPYDGLDTWRGNHFPRAVFEAQFRKLSDGWASGLTRLQAAAARVPAGAASASRRAALDDLMNVAEAAYCHFRTTFLQTRFIRLRDASAAPGGDQGAGAARDESALAPDRCTDHEADAGPDALLAILDEEIQLARRLWQVMRRDSRIGYEASNHYYYTENALMEKVLNCDRLKERLRRDAKGVRDDTSNGSTRRA